MQARIKKQYLELIDQFPLLPIISDKDHAAAIKVILGLSKRDGQLNATEIGYGRVLASLIAEYEQKKLGDYFTKEKSTGPEILAYLLEENQMMQIEAAEIAGVSKATINSFLAGRRNLPRQARERLADRFKLAPAIFDSPPQER